MEKKKYFLLKGDAFKKIDISECEDISDVAFKVFDYNVFYDYEYSENFLEDYYINDDDADTDKNEDPLEERVRKYFGTEEQMKKFNECETAVVLCNDDKRIFLCSDEKIGYDVLLEQWVEDQGEFIFE